MESRFPKLWTPSAEQRDLRQLLIHRHKLVEIRTRAKNGLQHLALNCGIQKQRARWSVRGRACLEKLPLAGWTARRREDLLRRLAELDRHLDELDEAVIGAAEQHPQARLLMTQPGVGPITSLAFVLTIGDVSRFKHSNQVASYLGLIPSEYTSGGKQRLGSISKQGNRFMRQLLVEAVQTVNRLMKDFANSMRLVATTSPKA
jgi:transposase